MEGIKINHNRLQENTNKETRAATNYHLRWVTCRRSDISSMITRHAQWYPPEKWHLQNDHQVRLETPKHKEKTSTYHSPSLGAIIKSLHWIQPRKAAFLLGPYWNSSSGFLKLIRPQVWSELLTGSPPELASLCLKERLANWDSRSLLPPRLWREECSGCCCCCCGCCICWWCWYSCARSRAISLSSTSRSTASEIRNKCQFHGL